MPIICPTVTAAEPHEYRAQVELLEQFAKRIHIDLMDGQFAPTVSVGIDQVWWPENMTADLHLMHQQPYSLLPKAIELRPAMVIVHAEANGDLAKIAVELHQHGVKAGLALLAETQVGAAEDLIPHFDHVMVFGGHLGYHGGTADLSQLDKVKTLKQKFPHMEIGWDGGVNDQNARQLAESGVDVLNAGGFIHASDSPQEAYAKLETVVKGV